MRDLTREILGENGAVAKFLGSGYEPREEQLAMAKAVSQTLAAKGVLIAEAGTGRGSVRPLADHELATRLAYFLWSAPPDDELLTAHLSDPPVLEAQTRRLN